MLEVADQNVSSIPIVQAILLVLLSTVEILAKVYVELTQSVP